MYNFSGIVYRIWASDGIILLLGCFNLLLTLLKDGRFQLKKCALFLVIIAIGLGLCLFHVSRIYSPQVSSYTGEFISSYRDSRVAPPLPCTYGYRFGDGKGYKKVVYLDAFSKKKIAPDEFVVGQEYTVYYDEFTRIIVMVEKNN